jgi:hypothetical protein
VIEDAPFTFCASEDELPGIPSIDIGVVPWQQYFGVRNALLARLREFGTVGPMGDTPIYPGERQPNDGWVVESSRPDYFVVDDQVTERCLHHHVEVQSSAFMTGKALSSLWGHIEEYPRWSVGIAVPKLRYLFLRDSSIWFLAPGLASCSSLAEALALPVVVARAH